MDNIPDIHQRLSIENILSSHGHSYSTRGNLYVSKCPLPGHNEKTGSFKFKPHEGGKQRFKCFGCGEGGDQIDLHALMNRSSVAESIKSLCEAFGLSSESSRNPIYDINKHLQECLSTHIPKWVHDYFLARGFTMDSLSAWGIGYWPHEFHPDRANMKMAGLMSKNDSYLLSGRITFPLYDRTGRIVSFAGRIREGVNGPKYINGQETAVYKKENYLYGISRHKRGSVPVQVEGYTDVIALHEQGISALALCGTSITSGHVEIVKSLSPEVIVATDGDAAGIKSAVKSCEMYLTNGVSPRFAIMKGKDPADSPKECAEIIKNPTGAITFMSSISDAEDTSEKITQIKYLCKTISTCNDPISLNMYMRDLADTFRLPFNEIKREVIKIQTENGDY